MGQLFSFSSPIYLFRKKTSSHTIQQPKQQLKFSPLAPPLKSKSVLLADDSRLTLFWTQFFEYYNHLPHYLQTSSEYINLLPSRTFEIPLLLRCITKNLITSRYFKIINQSLHILITIKPKPTPSTQFFLIRI